MKNNKETELQSCKTNEKCSMNLNKILKRRINNNQKKSQEVCVILSN